MNRYYITWQQIKQRCYNPNNVNYKRYGGRGIKLYSLWIDDSDLFIEYVSQLTYSDDLNRSIDRINNDGDYEPGNLRWATYGTQAQNRRSNKLDPEKVQQIKELYLSKQCSNTEIANKFGVSVSRITAIIKKGSWS